MSKTFWLVSMLANATLAGINGHAIANGDGLPTTIAFVVGLVATFMCIDRLLDK